jgi:hypothetical protein
VSGAIQKRRLAPMLSATKAKKSLAEGELDNSRWGTPRWMYDWLDRLSGFTVDVCADAGNYKHPRYFDEKINGLQQSWAGERWFCNPVYGAEISRWAWKCRDSVLESESMGWALYPHRADTEWWNRYVMQGDGEAGKLRACRYVPETRTHWYLWRELVIGVHVCDFRVPFEGAKHGAPFVSALVLYASLSHEPTPRPEEPSYDDKGNLLPELTLGWPR